MRRLRGDEDGGVSLQFEPAEGARCCGWVFEGEGGMGGGEGGGIGGLGEGEGEGDGEVDGKKGEGGSGDGGQEVWVLDGGFVKWAEVYGEDERLTEGFVRDVWM